MDFIDEPVDVAAPKVPDFSEQTRAPADFISLWSGPQIHGFSTPRHFGGMFTTPARTVLGLRAWDDAAEVVDDEDRVWALFDAEKLIRMLLHQSGLAFEILASPCVVAEADPPVERKRLIEAAVTTELTAYYRDATRARIGDWSAGETVADDEIRSIFRHLLTGLALVDGVVSLSLPRLVARSGRPALRALVAEDGRPQDLSAHARELFEQLEHSEGGVLPARPQDYDFLHDWLVERRLTV